jgi:hypothetical protein
MRRVVVQDPRLPDAICQIDYDTNDVRGLSNSELARLAARQAFDEAGVPWPEKGPRPFCCVIDRPRTSRGVLTA